MSLLTLARRRAVTPALLAAAVALPQVVGSLTPTPAAGGSPRSSTASPAAPVAASATTGTAATGLAGVTVPTLRWTTCADGLECATARVPIDYDKPRGTQIDLAVIRHPAADQAHRIGSVFVNPGGPGGSGLEFLKTAPPGALDVFPRFDFVSWDPRGIGASRPLVDCTTDAEDDARGNIVFTRPETEDRAALVAEARAFTRACERRNATILPHLSTADTARDLDLLRAAVGDDRLSYIGISHGTHIGATYSTLFPTRVRAMIADSPVDPDVWVNRPAESLRELAGANERGLQRFFAACAAAGTRCGFGGSDPEAAYDALVARANADPIPAPGSISGKPVNGDDILAVVTELVLARSAWPFTARALAQAEAGDASLIRGEFGERADGSHPPTGAFFNTTNADWRTSEDVGSYLREGRHLAGTFAHQFWEGHGYEDLAYATSRVTGEDAFRGPWTHPAAASPALVIGSTYDARTPFAWAKRYVAQLGNARLLTFVADQHGAAVSLNFCVLGHAIRYLTDLTLPPAGASCVQAPPFPAAASSAAREGGGADERGWRIPPLLGRPD